MKEKKPMPTIAVVILALGSGVAIGCALLYAALRFVFDSLLGSVR
jgi:hypothetical protein